MRHSPVTAITCALLLLSATPVLAKESASPSAAVFPQHEHAFGLTGSWLSGSGFTYRHWFENEWGFQIAAVPFIAPQFTFVNGGGQVMKHFFRNDKVRIFGLAGVGVGYYTDNTVVGIPVGAGLDWFVSDNLLFNLSLGYTLSSNHANRQDVAFDTFMPAPGVGFLMEW